MEYIEKRPYELSLWEDAITVDVDKNIASSEKRLMVIGTHTSLHLISN